MSAFSDGVAAAYLDILRVRHPDVVWTRREVEGPETVPTLTGQIVGRLATPAEVQAAGERSAA